MNLAGRTVLLTGATGGLGHAIARRLHRAGAQLVLSGRRSAVLARERDELAVPPAGALVFTCNGRGRSMFGVPDHDAATLEQELGGAPAAGFFAAGEIGPVGGDPFLHGFTATVAVFPA